MSKHFHKYQNKKPVGAQTYFNPEGSLHENWVDGFNTGQEVGAKNGLMTGWSLGMSTAGIILAGICITEELMKLYQYHKRKTELEKITIEKSYENSENDDLFTETGGKPKKEIK